MTRGQVTLMAGSAANRSWIGAAMVAVASFLAIAAPLAPAAPVPAAADGDYLLRMEAPYARESPQWLPLDVQVRVKDGKPVEAFATAQQFNVTWHEVDVSGLKLEANAFAGEVKVAFRRDDFQAAAFVAAKGKVKHDPFPNGLTPQPISIRCPIGTVTGSAPGEATCEQNLLHFQKRKPPAPKARAWREATPDPAKPRYIEFYLPRWADDGKPGTYDGMYGNASVLIRGTIVNGKVQDLTALQGPERYQLQYADLVWSIPQSDLKLDGDKLSGEVTLAPSSDSAVRDVVNKRFSWHPLPDSKVKLQIQGKVIGTALAATAQVINGEKKHESSLTGHLRSFPFVPHGDRTARTWQHTAEPDTGLIEAAKKESLVPIRPGEPGKRPFWSDWVRFGGFDYFIENGKKVVQTDRFNGPILRKVDFGPYSVRVVDYDKYIAKPLIGWSGAYHGITPPSFNLKPVAGAVKYRFTVEPPKISAEVDQPWKPLAELWRKLPPAAATKEVVTIEALDAGGKVVGEPVKIPLRRHPPFQGPYFKLPRTYREAAILSARWMRDNPVSAFARVGVGYPGVGGAGGDGQMWYTNYCTMYAGLVLAQLADDPAERAEGLHAAIVTADTWLRSFMSNYLPDTYKGWAFDQWVYGTAWLDLYRLTGDQRYREAVMLQCKRLAEKQLPSGTWTEVDPVRGQVDIDPKSGRPWVVSLQGPTMQQWDPSSVLYYLGRVRKELKTDDFKGAEDRAYRWVTENSVAKMDWRKQGPHASEDHRMPWLTLPDCALHFFHYVALDLPGRTPDWELMADLLRWSEDRDVDWRRIHRPTSVYPRIIYIGKNRDTQMRLALAFAVLAKHTKNPLHLAKAEALAGAMLVSQLPTTGQIPHFPDIDTTLKPHPGYSGPGSGDGGNRGEYATMALLELWKLLGRP